MVDIHCHILPGLDDGSDNIEESVRMARLAADGGTSAIIVTPHSNIPGSVSNYYDSQYSEKFDTLKKRIREENISLELYMGHEIFASGDVVGMIKSQKLLTLNNSDYPLIEFAFDQHSDSVYRKLGKLIAEGFTPVIAHPERYSFVIEDSEALAKLKKLGCLLQVNKGSLKGSFGKKAYEASQRIIAEELADVIASDAHSPYRRTPYLVDAYGLICENHSREYAHLLLSVNPKKILRNQKIN